MTDQNKEDSGRQAFGLACLLSDPSARATLAEFGPEAENSVYELLAKQLRCAYKGGE